MGGRVRVGVRRSGWRHVALASALVGCGPHLSRGPAAAQIAGEPSPAVVVGAPANVGEAWIAAVIRGGSSFDPIGQEGLAAVAMASSFAEGLDGRPVEADVGRELARVRVRCPAEEASACATALAARLAEPQVAEADVAAAREQLAARARSPGEATAREALDAWIFEGTPYGHPVTGRHGVLATIDAADVRAWWGRLATRGGVTFGAWPGVDVGAAWSAAARALPPAMPVDRPLMGPAPIAAPQALCVQREGATEVAARWGHATPLDAAHVDAVAWAVGWAALAASAPASVVVDGGLPWWGEARPSVSMEVRAPSPGAAATAFAAGWQAWVAASEGQIGADAVEAGRRAVGGALAAAQADGASRLTVALTAASAGRADPLADGDLAERVAAVGEEEVAAALRQHLRTDQVRLVVVGEDRDAMRAAWAAVDPVWGAPAGWVVVPEPEVFR